MNLPLEETLQVGLAQILISPLMADNLSTLVKEESYLYLLLQYRKVELLQLSPAESSKDSILQIQIHNSLINNLKE